MIFASLIRQRQWDFPQGINCWPITSDNRMKSWTIFPRNFLYPSLPGLSSDWRLFRIQVFSIITMFQYWSRHLNEQHIKVSKPRIFEAHLQCHECLKHAFLFREVPLAKRPKELWGADIRKHLRKTGHSVERTASPENLFENKLQKAERSLPRWWSHSIWRLLCER